MNNITSQWPQSDLAPLPDDDFSGYLDFDNTDFPFLESLNVGGTALGGAQDVNTEMTDASSFLESNAFGGDLNAGLRQQQQQQQQQQHQQQYQPQPPSQIFEQTDGISNPYAFGLAQTYDVQQTPNFSAPSNLAYIPQCPVPPTPNSSMIHPEAYRYLQQNDPQSSHRWPPYQLRKDDAMALHTPLVSPDVPTNDAIFPYLDFSPKDPYGLSPLTSPAIHPQTSAHRTPLMQSHTAESSLTASPIDLNFGLPLDMPPSVNERPKRTRRKLQSSRASSRGRPPPVTANGRRRGSLSVSIPVQDSISTIPEGAPMDIVPDSRDHSRRQSWSEHREFSSSSKSMPPQPPTEASMAPPPKPDSAHGVHSGLSSQTISPSSNAQPPVTPASMMRLLQIQNSTSSNQFSPVMSPSFQSSPSFMPTLRTTLEDLHLPDAAVPHSTDGQSTPRPTRPLATRRKTATPANSATASPAVGPTASPSIVASTPKTDAKNARNTRKRLSAANSLVSPAIRPKISPSIKPLLPEGTNLTTEAQAILLASKSNYQNIIEGNHVPGVVYPTDLTTNISSKRTSHKLAEQGRRNRINTALQELHTLLPAVVASPSAKDDAERTTADSPTSPAQDNMDQIQPPNGSRTPALTAQQNNSKAATVELAIDHIKHLNIQVAAKDAEIEALKRQMQELKHARKKMSSCSCSTSEKSGTEGVSGSGSERSTPSKEGSLESDGAETKSAAVSDAVTIDRSSSSPPLVEMEDVKA